LVLSAFYLFRFFFRSFFDSKYNCKKKANCGVFQKSQKKRISAKNDSDAPTKVKTFKLCVCCQRIGEDQSFNQNISPESSQFYGNTFYIVAAELVQSNYQKNFGLEFFFSKKVLHFLENSESGSQNKKVKLNDFVSSKNSS